MGKILKFGQTIGSQGIDIFVNQNSRIEDQSEDQSARLDSLINTETGSWNVNRVKQILTASAVAEVLKIFVSPSQR